MSGVDGLKGLLDKAKTFTELNKHADSLHIIALAKTRRQLPSEAEAWKLLHKALHEDRYLPEKDVVEFFKDRTFFAKERSLRNRTGKQWAWFFYNELGYRIVEDKETELYLKKAMRKVLDEAFSEKRFKGSVEGQK